MFVSICYYHLVVSPITPASNGIFHDQIDEDEAQIKMDVSGLLCCTCKASFSAPIVSRANTNRKSNLTGVACIYFPHFYGKITNLRFCYYFPSAV